jgi:ABC-type glycerol-3-phosphate transport system substrate-binding protein
VNAIALGARRGRVLALIAVALVLSTLALARPAPTAAQDEELPKLTMWGWPTALLGFFDTEDDKLVDRIRDELGIELELIQVDQPEVGPKLKAALPAGQGPDLVATDFDVMAPYWTFMEPLDAYAAAEWGDDWRSRFTAPSMEELQLVSEIAGKPGEALYLPGNVQLLGYLMYSRPIFEQVGIDPASIATVDDFFTACSAIREAGIAPMSTGGHPAALVDYFQTFVEVTAPEKLAQAQVGQAKFTDPDIVAAFDLTKRFFDECAQEGAVAEQSDPAIFPPIFAGDAAMGFYFGGTPWFGFVADVEGGGRDWITTKGGTLLFPGGKGLAATDAGVAIVADSPNKDLAWEVVKWFVAGPEIERLAARGEPVAFADYPPAATGTDFDQYIQAPLMDAMANGDNKFRRILCADVYSALTQVIPGVVQGQIDAATAGQEVQDAFDRGCGDWVQ